MRNLSKPGGLKNNRGYKNTSNHCKMPGLNDWLDGVKGWGGYNVVRVDEYRANNSVGS